MLLLLRRRSVTSHSCMKSKRTHMPCEGHGAKAAGGRCKGDGRAGGGTARQWSQGSISFPTYCCFVVKQTSHGQA